MSLEPSLAATVNRLDATEFTDWSAYRACTQVCGVKIGEPCVSLSGRIINGRPDRVRTVLAVPHSTRKRRTRRAKQ